jgi:hypothetical protein
MNRLPAAENLNRPIAANSRIAMDFERIVHRIIYSDSTW